MRIRPSVRIGWFTISPGGGRRAMAPRPGRVRLRGSDFAFLAGAAVMLVVIFIGAAVTR